MILEGLCGMDAGSIGRLYFEALYWSLGSVLCIGPSLSDAFMDGYIGFFRPLWKTPPGYVYLLNTISSVLGLCLMSLLFGNTLILLQSYSQTTVMFRNKMNTIYHEMSYYDVPKGYLPLSLPFPFPHTINMNPISS